MTFFLYSGLIGDWSRAVERVRLAEGLGFDSFWVAITRSRTAATRTTPPRSPDRV